MVLILDMSVYMVAARRIHHGMPWPTWLFREVHDNTSPYTGVASTIYGSPGPFVRFRHFGLTIIQANSHMFARLTCTVSCSGTALGAGNYMRHGPLF